MDFAGPTRDDDGPVLRFDDLRGALAQMAGVNESDYYRRREEQERALAAASALPDVQAIHRDMADRYAELAQGAAGETERPNLSLAF